jgi:signal transduction histidine kinase
VHGSTLEVDGKPFLAIHVEDTGAGIPPESIGSLFQEFAQADNSETREFAGTGLGLAICRELVELHGGKVWVEST